MTTEPREDWDSVRPAYGLERSPAETERLALQERLIGATTRRFLIDAGISPGMRVLDIGSGAGDVSMCLARIVGPTGSVVGVEVDVTCVQTARDRVGAAGFQNVDFVVADLADAEPGWDFDAAVGRLIVMHLRDPVVVLRRLADLVRPGGVLAFQEAHLASPWLSFPASATLEKLQRVRQLDVEQARRPVNLHMGLALRQVFVSSGLPAPTVRADVLIGGGPDWEGYEFVQETVRSALPLWRRLGLNGAEEIQPEGLATRLRREIGDHGLLMLYPLVSAWSCLPD